ncbi:MAG TPA: low molecular weight protein-tyrosine-phosphatase [Solirubrobacteraceae bacterium]
MRVLFVCLGNICRSPTAEGVMAQLVSQAGLQNSIELDSAGTGAWHVGSSPDARASAAAAKRGILLEGTARQVTQEDFHQFDMILAMDRSNLADLRRIAPDHQSQSKLGLLREFDPASAAVNDLDVPDPYYTGAGGFDEVLDLVQGACEGLLSELRARLPA